MYFPLIVWMSEPKKQELSTVIYTVLFPCNARHTSYVHHHSHECQVNYKGNLMNTVCNYRKCSFLSKVAEIRKK